MNSVRDKNNLLSEKGFVSLIRDYDKNWANHLYKYRSSLIHNKRDNAESTQVLEIKQEEFSINFNVQPPQMFMKNIKILKQEFPGDSISVLEVAPWLTTITLTSINKIVKCMIDDLPYKI
jgi:hypothetical protein